MTAARTDAGLAAKAEPERDAMTLHPIPRLATEKAAAAVGLDLATFRAWVECGRLPQAIPDVGLFDLKAIDAALDRLSGLGSPKNALDAWRERRNAS